MAKIEDGAEIKEILKTVFCPGFARRIRLDDCTAENCVFHLGIRTDEKVKADFVLCGRPTPREIVPVYEVTDGGSS